MTESHAAHNCRWGVPTIQLPWPFWYAAAADAWTCRRNDVPRILHDSDVCRACPRWAPCDRRTATTPQATCEFHHALIFRPDADVDIPSVS